MADKPQERPLNPIDRLYAEKLLLPSFETTVSRSDPSSVAIPAGWGTEGFSLVSGDAFSLSYLRESSDATTIKRGFTLLGLGYLKRILLYILYEEEYERIEEHHSLQTSQDIEEFVTRLSGGERTSSSALEADRDSHPRAQVRLTDLRLAKDIKPVELRRELGVSLRDLPLPLTAEGVVAWKWETLRTFKELRVLNDLIENEKWYKEEQVRIEAVTFAAAALLLLVDLDRRGLEKGTHDTLLEHVVTLFGIIRRLIVKLDDSASEVLQLVAGRKGTHGGRPPKPDARYYVALILYRIGRPAKEVARRVGIKAPGRGISENDVSKNWRSNLREFVKQGVAVEEERFPNAAEVFARRNEERVKAKAIELYRHYLEQKNWEKAGEYVGGVGIGDDLLRRSLGIDERDQLYAAFAQLGACLEEGINPLPNTTSDVKLRS